MTAQTTIQETLKEIRSNALIVAKQHERHKAAWHNAKKEASELALQIYGLAGIDPAIPPDRWEWRARDMPLRLVGVCDEVLLKVTDHDIKRTIESVRSIMSIFDGAKLAHRSRTLLPPRTVKNG